MMRPLSIAERQLEEPIVSLAAMLNQPNSPVEGLSSLDIPAYTEEILASGFPGIRDLPERARTHHLDGYISRLISRDLSENGLRVRKPLTLRKWLEAYAASTATSTSYSKLLRAATADLDERPAKETTITYRDHLEHLFILEPLEGWIPVFTPLKRLTEAPKHHLVDPALAAHLLGIDKDSLLRGVGPRSSNYAGTWLGALFESLVTQSVRVYAEAAEAQVFHMRTKGGEREVDLFVQRRDHSILALEVKLASEVENEDVKHLNWLEQEVGDRLIDKLLNNTGPAAYRREDGVAVVPHSLLGP